MPDNKNLFQNAKEKMAQAGEFLSEKTTETGELISDKASLAMDKASQAGEFLSDRAAAAKRDYDLRRFRPITKEQLDSEIRVMPEMIHITDWDKRTEEDVCKGAVAFNDGTKELRALSILTENANLLNASFYPTAQEGVYYRDPCDPTSFINLNDYFEYIKKAKVHELNQIAQALGAKHVKITLKAEKKQFVQDKGKIGAAVGKKSKTEVSHSDSNKQFVSIEVASDKKYKGHDANRPELNYFKNEPDIQNIILRRLDKDNPIYSDIEIFKYTNSSGIKRNDAAKIEGILKKLKISGSSSISTEIENEEKIYFEYQIEYPED